MLPPVCPFITAKSSWAPGSAGGSRLETLPSLIVYELGLSSASLPACLVFPEHLHFGHGAAPWCSQRRCPQGVRTWCYVCRLCSLGVSQAVPCWDGIAVWSSHRLLLCENWAVGNLFAFPTEPPESTNVTSLSNHQQEREAAGDKQRRYLSRDLDAAFSQSPWGEVRRAGQSVEPGLRAWSDRRGGVSRAQQSGSLLLEEFSTPGRMPRMGGACSPGCRGLAEPRFCGRRLLWAWAEHGRCAGAAAKRRRPRGALLYLGLLGLDAAVPPLAGSSGGSAVRHSWQIGWNLMSCWIRALLSRLHWEGFFFFSWDQRCRSALFQKAT